MRLSSEVITTLAKLRSNIAALVKEEEELTKEIKQAIKEQGHIKAQGVFEFEPQACQLKLVLTTFDKASVSWKDQWVELAKQMFGSDWEEEQTKISEASKKPTSTLTIGMSENYIGVK